MWNSSREWMYNRIDGRTNNISKEFLAGVEQFMNFANNQPMAQNSGGRFYCPCVKCQNDVILHGTTISNHLHSKGFMPNYYVWSEHGEDYDVLGVGTSSHYPNTNYTSTSSQHGSQPGSQPIGFEGNVYAEMVNDAFHGTTPFNEYHEYESGYDHGYDHIHEEPTEEAKRFYDMLDAANTPLYDGCHEGHSQLSLASRFMNIKVDNNLSEACMDDWAELFTEVLPEGNQATGSYYETETLVRKIGLPYHTIDVCIENCMIFWKEDGNLEHCKFCGKPRYKSSGGRTRIPFSRMWYLPIADRLKRMYQSEKTASSMRWHAEHDSEDGVMCHPSDAPEWKNFQHLHPTFAQEPRNVYLGLCTDGFNPFGVSKNHSLWPVIPVYDTPIGKLGAAICWENRMPLYRTALYAKGIEIYCAPTADGYKEWQSSMLHIAMEGGCFVLSACQFCQRKDFPEHPDYLFTDLDNNKEHDAIVSQGGSVIISPLGQVLAGPNFESEGLITADLDLGEIARAKLYFDVVGHYSKPDVLSLTVNEHPKKPVIFVSKVE